MIKFHQEKDRFGTSLGYQISSYFIMRSIVEKTGLDWYIEDDSFLALRNTFDELKINVSTNQLETTEKITFGDSCGFSNIIELVKDDSELFLYPTPTNFPSDKDLFLKIKKELKFKKDIFDKCKSFRDQFDGEVIGLHIRRGDFVPIHSGKFLCGIDYYENALAKLPDNIPVLIFTNDKNDIPFLDRLILSNPDRFVIITDLFNDNNPIDCDIGNQIDRLIDVSGSCRFNYKDSLLEVSKNKLDSGANHDDILEEVSNIVKKLHPKYIEKLKGNLYNYSFDFCLMTMCDYIIMANSTFSMWSSELGSPKKVIYPMYWIQDHDGQTLIKKDLDGYDQTRKIGSHWIDKSNYVGVENPDPRSFTRIVSSSAEVKKYDNNYFYKFSNVIPEEILPELYESAVYWLEKTRKPITQEVYPPEASQQLLSISELVESELWQKFYSQIRKHVNRYCTISEINSSTIKIHSSWITRIADIEFPGTHTKKDLEDRLKQHNVFGNMHSHIDNPIGMIYYLKNPDPKYGTIVKLSDNEILHNDGEENSLIIFDPRLYHTALYPPISVSKKYPRMTIIVDCCYK